MYLTALLTVILTLFRTQAFAQAPKCNPGPFSFGAKITVTGMCLPDKYKSNTFTCPNNGGSVDL
ncbi:hypothetical protein FKW77_008192 [Venturia effusa]|uniref:Cyanovirin-N domain-containing protein n=1 Tax=Venturia effusa TaxID=50376 RepID=A0A517L1R3_9PEZI|nr:hypothetical protein FKW77_008192 [Venturia effusa]